MTGSDFDGQTKQPGMLSPINSTASGASDLGKQSINTSEFAN